MASEKIQELLSLIANIEQKVSDKVNITDIQALCDQMSPLCEELASSLKETQDSEIKAALLAVRMYLENINSSAKNYRFYNENQFFTADFKLAKKALSGLKDMLNKFSNPLSNNLLIPQNSNNYFQENNVEKTQQHDEEKSEIDISNSLTTISNTEIQENTTKQNYHAAPNSFEGMPTEILQNILLKEISSCQTFVELMQAVMFFRSINHHCKALIQSDHIQKLLIENFLSYPGDLYFNILTTCVKFNSTFPLLYFREQLNNRIAYLSVILFVLTYNNASFKIFKAFLNQKFKISDPSDVLEQVIVIYKNNQLENEEKLYILDKIIAAYLAHHEKPKKNETARELSERSLTRKMALYKELVLNLQNPHLITSHVPTIFINDYLANNFTLFQQALMSHLLNMDVINSLIKKGADVNKFTKDGKHILYFLFEKARQLHQTSPDEFTKIIQLIELLIENGLKLDYPQAAKDNLIHAATKPYQIDELVEVLLACKAYSDRDPSYSSLHFDIVLQEIHFRTWQATSSFKEFVKTIDGFFAINKWHGSKKTSDIQTIIITILNNKPPSFLDTQILNNYMAKCLISKNYFWLEILCSLDRTKNSIIISAMRSSIENYDFEMFEKLLTFLDNRKCNLTNEANLLTKSVELLFKQLDHEQKLTIKRIILILTNRGLDLSNNENFIIRFLTKNHDNPPFEKFLFLSKNNLFSTKVYARLLGYYFGNLKSLFTNNRNHSLQIIDHILDKISAQANIADFIKDIPEISKESNPLTCSKIASIFKKLFLHNDPILNDYNNHYQNGKIVSNFCLKAAALSNDLQLIAFFTKKIFKYEDSSSVRMLSFTSSIALANQTITEIKAIKDIINYNDGFLIQLHNLQSSLRKNNFLSTKKSDIILDILSDLYNYIQNNITTTPKIMLKNFRSYRENLRGQDPIKLLEQESSGILGLFLPKYVQLLDNYANGWSFDKNIASSNNNNVEPPKNVVQKDNNEPKEEEESVVTTLQNNFSRLFNTEKSQQSEISEPKRL